MFRALGTVQSLCHISMNDETCKFLSPVHSLRILVTKTEKSFLAIAVCFQMHHDDNLDGGIFPVVFRPFVLIFGNSSATATWLEIFFRLTGDQWKEETDPFVTFPQQCVFILPLPLGFISLLNFL